MDLTNPAVLLIVAAISSAVTAALMDVLKSYLGRRKDASAITQQQAETKRTEAVTRHAEEDETRKKWEHRLSMVEELGAAETSGVKEALAALERSRATIEQLRGELAALQRSHAAQIEGLTQGMAALERSHASQVESLTQGMDGLTAQVLELTAKIASLEELIAKEQSAYSMLVESLNARIAGMEGVIAALEKRINDLVSQIEGLGAVPVAAAESATAGETVAALP